MAVEAAIRLRARECASRASASERLCAVGIVRTSKRSAACEAGEAGQGLQAEERRGGAGGEGREK